MSSARSMVVGDSRSAASRVRIAALFGVSAFFALLMLCALAVGLTWDTDYRILTLGLLAGLFVAIAVGTAAVLSRKREAPFAALRREWQEDRALVRDFLTRGSAQPPRSVPSEFAQQREEDPVWLHR